MDLADLTCAGEGEILVVEDTPESLALLSQILIDAGYAVRQAPDGELALWTLNTRAPDLLLLDVRMPGLDGFEVCRRLKADPKLAQVPVIFLSALDAVEDKVKGLTLGAVDYIAKPYRPEEVLARVKTHITMFRLRRDLAAERERLEARVLERTAELERQKQEMENILKAMDLAGDGIVKVGPDGRIRYANRTLLDTIGLTDADDLFNRRLEEVEADGRPIISPRQIADLRRAVAAVGHWQGELLLRGGDGRGERRLLAHVRALPDQGRVAIMTDVTDARRREDEQHRLEQELTQARRLEALGQLAGGVAHDFNNLLGAILGFAQFIAEDSAADSPQRRYAQRIIKAGQQAKSLIGQILAFSQRREAHREPLDLAAMLEENISIFRAVVAPSTELTVKPPDGPMVVAGQRNQLAQIVMNLAVNGSEACGDRGGKVTIDILRAAGEEPGEEPGATPHIEPLIEAPLAAGPDACRPTLWEDGDGWLHAALGRLDPRRARVVLRVGDDGDGMDMKTLSSIFTPFFTTKGTAGGSGLGLALVLSATAAHGGAIRVVTAPGRGSRFEVILPECAEPAPAGRPEPSALPVAGQRGSILLVDDSTHFGDMLTTALFRLGYEISACDDPLEAMEYIQEDPGAWDLLITDHMMMHMTGVELVAEAKKIRPDLPCVVCTAFPAGVTEEMARRAGADGFAVKPLDLGKFSLLVGEVLAKARAAAARDRREAGA